MYAKILVPLDGSPLAETVLPYARSLARALKMPVELLQVIEADVMRAFAEYGRSVEIIEAVKKASLEYLEAVAGSFPDRSAVGCSAEIGSTAEVIIDRAISIPRILIAMATHGRSGISRWLLGSVAEKVLRGAKSHLLLVRPRDGETTSVAALKVVLVPLDGSRLAEKALPHAVALAKEMSLEVVLLRAYDVMEAAYIREGYRFDLDLRREKIKKDAEDYLEENVRELQKEGLPRVSCLLLEGDAAAEIISQARKVPDNLVMMCTHGRSGLGRWMLGSVTDRVVRHSGDPVLVIPA